MDKAIGIKGPADVYAMGIDKYNAECRSIVMRYSKEWEQAVERMGRRVSLFTVLKFPSEKINSLKCTYIIDYDVQMDRLQE